MHTVVNNRQPTAPQRAVVQDSCAYARIAGRRRRVRAQLGQTPGTARGSGSSCVPGTTGKSSARVRRRPGPVVRRTRAGQERSRAERSGGQGGLRSRAKAARCAAKRDCDVSHAAATTPHRAPLREPRRAAAEASSLTGQSQAAPARRRRRLGRRQESSSGQSGESRLELKLCGSIQLTN